MTWSYYLYGGAAGAGPTMFCIDVVNTGHRPVTVGAPTIRHRGKQLVPFNADGFHDFPKELTDGAAASIRVPIKDVAQSLANHGFSGVVKVTPACNEAGGRTFYGKTIKFDLASALADEVAA
jgi:hypothetical protein